MQQIKTARCLENSPLGPAGRGQLVIRIDEKKNHLKDEEGAQERAQESTQCERGYGQTINYGTGKNRKSTF